MKKHIKSFFESINENIEKSFGGPEKEVLQKIIRKFIKFKDIKEFNVEATSYLSEMETDEEEKEGDYTISYDLSYRKTTGEDVFFEFSISGKYMIYKIIKSEREIGDRDRDMPPSGPIVDSHVEDISINNIYIYTKDKDVPDIEIDDKELIFKILKDLRLFDDLITKIKDVLEEEVLT